MRFNKGDKVICKVGFTCANAAKEVGQTVKNECYTVRKFETFLGVDIVYLHGFKRGVFFMADRFRPLHDEVSNSIIQQVGAYPKNLK